MPDTQVGKSGKFGKCDPPRLTESRDCSAMCAAPTLPPTSFPTARPTTYTTIPHAAKHKQAATTADTGTGTGTGTGSVPHEGATASATAHHAVAVSVVATIAGQKTNSWGQERAEVFRQALAACLHMREDLVTVKNLVWQPHTLAYMLSVRVVTATSGKAEALKESTRDSSLASMMTNQLYRYL